MISIGSLWKHNGWHIAAVNRLLQILSPKKPKTVDFHGLSDCFANPHFKIYTAEDGLASRPNRVVGMATLFFQRIPSGWIAEIHDVARDENYHGQGIGEKLLTAMLNDVRAHAKKYQSPVKLSLTSRPAREPANDLYLKMGFRIVAQAVGKDGTNLYRMDIYPTTTP